MIRNDREYRITKAQAVEFERSLAALDARTSSEVHPRIRQAQHDAVQSQLVDLRTDVADYEALRDGKRDVLELTSLNQIPGALIEGRIAAGLTLRELAERLSVPEQQVQRYEATDYATVSFSRLVEVATALGLTFREDVFLPQVEVSEAALVRRLADAGVDGIFARRVLLGRIGHGEKATPSGVLRATGAAQRIFGWTPNEILAGTRTLAVPRADNAALFKVYKGAEERRTVFLAAFARYVAQLLLRATPSLEPKPIPNQPTAFRELVLQRFGAITLNSVVSTLWDLGVIVVGLSDSGGFHGACWRIAGRNVIVLKQGARTEARWLHDLLHETWHAASVPDEPEFGWLDDEILPAARRNSPEEKRASRFAGDVQLNGRAEELARECVDAASKKVERLKAVVPRVALARGVPTGALANYLAWRLTLDGVNWWGTAANLQERDGEPLRVVRDFLVPRVDWSRLDRLDRDILARTLGEDDE